MDFFDQLMAYSFLKSGSLSLKLEGMPQPMPVIQQRSGKEMMAAALTGRIRSDSTMLRQGAKNVTEASNMAGIVANSASTILSNLTDMLALAQENTAIISNSKYNGISLLDKSGWTGDSRLTVSSDGNSASLKIQAGYDNSKFTLNDMSYLNALASVDLSSSSLDLDALISTLSTNVNTANIIYSGNDALSKAYASESDFLVKQADMLAKAAKDVMPSEEDPLLRDIGSIVSTTS